MNISNSGDSNQTHAGPDNQHNRGVVLNDSVTEGITVHEESADILAKLRRAPAHYDSFLRKQAQECMQDTRVTILDIIYEWVNSFNDPPIFWLHGQAGIGKSTIAHTVAKECHRRGILGASFFFVHANAECSDPNLFFSTIAYQLSKHDPDLRQHIINGVRAYPSPHNASIPTQFEEFVLTPLCKLSNSATQEPIIVVVDALDECNDAKKASEILQLLSTKISSFPPRLKFFITSRPEPEIWTILHPEVDRVSRSFDLLRDVDASCTNEDIKRFVRFHLEKIGKEYDLPSWPRESDTETLIQQAGGFFIFAHTAIELIRDKDVMDPAFQLAMLKNVGSVDTPALNLNALYSRILQKAIPETGSTTMQERIITVIHAIVGLRAPLSICALERLLGLNGGAVRMALNRLRSVFIVPDNDEDTVQVIHPSFSRYIADEEFYTENKISVSWSQPHNLMAKHCLKKMKTCLKQNICNFKDFTAVEAPIRDYANSDVVSQSLSEELQYSCANFAVHVFSAGPQDCELCEMVAEWANQYLPYWLEVIALIGSIPDALPSLRLLRQFCETASKIELPAATRLAPQIKEQSKVLTGPSSQLARSSRLVNDAIRMVSESYNDIKTFPHQIYSSCLAFCPLASSLFERYSQRSTVRILRGERVHWRPLLHAFEDPDGSVVSLAFSPDGTMLASCSVAGKILLWNLETGESRSLVCHTLRRPAAFMFSLDGKYIAADGSVYRVTTGREVLIPGICSAFSTDGRYVALGGADGIIRLHDMQTPNLSMFGKPFGHGGTVVTLAFSSDNKLLASASSDDMIRVWNCSSREMVKSVPCREPNGYVTFSANGSYVAACYESYSWDGRFKTYVWVANIQTDEEKSIEVLGDLRHPKESTMIFSPSGKYIASCNNVAMYLADWVMPRTIRLGGLLSSVPAISFRPDEQRLLVGNEQGLIRSWYISKDGPVDAFDFECKAHFGAVQTIIFSHNGKHFASASVDGSICVWDSTSVNHYGSELTNTSVIHGQTVMFAPDGQAIAICSGSTISKMDAMTGYSIFHKQITMDEETRKHCLTFSADSNYLASNSHQMLLSWDTGSHFDVGKQRFPWGTNDPVVTYALSPDASQYAVLFSTFRDLWVYDLPSCDRLNMAPVDGTRFEKLVFSPDNRHLISCSGAICVFDVKVGIKMDLNLPFSRHVYDCAFSPHGRDVAYTDRDGLNIIEEYLKNQPNVRKVHGQFSYLFVTFSRDGKYILTAGNGDSEEGQLDLFYTGTLEKLYTVKLPWSGQQLGQLIREFTRTGRLLNHPLFQPPEYDGFPYLVDRDGWVITASSKRLCRLPVANRGEIYDVNGNRIVVVSPEGKVTLIQFGPNPVCIFTTPYFNSE